jgi:hypothetical protein
MDHQALKDNATNKSLEQNVDSEKTHFTQILKLEPTKTKRLANIIAIISGGATGIGKAVIGSLPLSRSFRRKPHS